MPNIYFSSKLVAVTGKDGKEHIRPSQAMVASIFNVRDSYPDERDVNIIAKNKCVLLDPFYDLLAVTRCTNVFLRSALQFWLVKYIISLGYTNKPLTTFVFAYMVTCNPLTGTLIGNSIIPKIGTYKDKKSLYIVTGVQILAVAAFWTAPSYEEWWKFCIFASLYQIIGMCNVALIGQVISSSLNKEQKKKQGNVMAILNVVIGSVPAPPIYGLILDRWGEYDKHVAMRAYRNYLNLTLIYLFIANLIREYRFSKEKSGEKLIDGKEEPKEVYQEPVDPITSGFTIKDASKEGTEMTEKV